jgi:hypothetical protein
MNRDHVNFFQKIIFILLNFFFLMASSASFAIPFNIVHEAGTSLPTQVVSGASVDAFYTITNNTGETRNNNYIKYLPPSVTQVTDAGNCGATFNLSPSGQAGDSCNLHLSVSGPVDSSDPDQHHMLFACFPGGITCAGTNEPLNVTLLPPILVSITISGTPTSIRPNATTQFTATGNYSDGTTQDLTATANWVSSNTAVATITGGLATGVAIGTTTIRASFGSPLITSNGIVLTVFSNAYISNSNSTTVSICPVINGTTGTIGTCVSTGQTFDNPQNIIFNSALTFAYIANSANNTVSNCPVSASGTFGACTLATSGFNVPKGIAINNNTSIVYVTSSAAPYVSICQVSPTGTLNTPCTNTAITGVFGAPVDIAVDSTGTMAYISDTSPVGGGGASITSCTIDAVTQDFDACTLFQLAGTITAPAGLWVNAAQNFLYVADTTNSVQICSIASGAVSSCTAAITSGGVVPTPAAITLNPTGTLAYVTSTAGNAYVCTVNATTGTLAACTVQTAVFNIPKGIAVH